jgi:xanthine/uracil permease
MFPNVTSMPPTESLRDVPPDRERIGWGRAILTGLATLVVGLAATVLVANLIMTKATGISRDTAGYLASAWFVVAVCLIAWILRRLQRRGLL